MGTRIEVCLVGPAAILALGSRGREFDRPGGPRNNWGTVQRWLERGVTFGTIAQWIMQILGIG